MRIRQKKELRETLWAAQTKKRLISRRLYIYSTGEWSVSVKPKKDKEIVYEQGLTFLKYKMTKCEYMKKARNTTTWLEHKLN